jgi:hypothetical protein
MKQLAIAILLIIAPATHPASAFDTQSDGGIKTYWWHITSCGQYAQDRHFPPNIGQHATDRAYVAGWLSAYNALIPGHNLGGGDARLDDTLLWLDRYCLDHPFATIQRALVEFSDQVAPRLPRD